MNKGLNDRHQQILKIVSDQGYIRVNELGEMLNVSLVTIRKDLNYLEQKSLLYRTHGGASKIERFAFEKTISEKEFIQPEAKLTIAKCAYQMIKAQDFVSLASGTTVLFLARQLTNEDKITVLTNSLSVSMEVARLSNVEVIQLGGNVRKSSRSITGSIALNMTAQFCSNILFLGVDGIDTEFGISTSNQEEAEINRLMMKQADKVVVLADSSKLGKKGFSKIANLNEVDTIITDSNIEAEAKSNIEEFGVEVVISN